MGTKPKMMWAGFVDGELDYIRSATYSDESWDLPALFPTRRLARSMYQDVRKVRVAVQPARKRKPQGPRHAG